MPGCIICRQVIIVERAEPRSPIAYAESERYEMTLGTEKLLHCLRKEPAEARFCSLRQYCAADWEEIAAAAEQHGVAPLLYHTIKDCLDGLDIPQDVTEEMRRKYYVAAARNIRLYRELGKILDLLARKGIRVIVLKGTHLAETVYGNIALRFIGDVDLLVSQEDLKSVDESLLEAGAQPMDCNRVIAGWKFNFGYVLSESKLMVEIHWKLVGPDLPCQIDYGGIWSRAQRWQLGRTEVLALAPEDLLVYVCLHAAKDIDRTNIRMLYDIAEVVSYFESVLDWAAICARARQWAVSRAVYALLRLARELLGAAISGEQLAALRPAEFEEQRFLFIRRHVLDGNADVNMAKTSPRFAQLLTIVGLNDKVSWILERVFPSRNRMAVMYPARPDSWRVYLYYPVWFKDLLRQYGGIAWSWVRGDVQTRIATERSRKLMSVRYWLMSG
jgi:hypothetical protein